MKLILVILLLSVTLLAEPMFFDETFTLRSFVTPSHTIEQSLTKDPATVTVTVDFSGERKRVLPTIFGHNENSVMGKQLLQNQQGLNHLRQAKIHTLRLPGGSWSNNWLWDGVNHWGDNLKEDYLSAEVKSLPTHSWTYTTDELLQVCSEIGAKPQICVNFALSRYIDTPDALAQAAHYAAEWVRDVNIKKDLGVTYWEVGNENYGGWEAGFIVNGDTITAEEYGVGFCVFADSMKAADPSIKVGAVILGDDWADIGDWTPVVLKKVQNHADFLVVHDYFNWNAKPDVITTNQILNGLSQIRGNRIYLDQCINQYTDLDAGTIPYAMTEFNIFGGRKNSTFISALFLSRALLEFTKEGYGLANFWGIVGAWGENEDDMGMLTYLEPDVADYSPRSTFFPYYYGSQFLGDTLIAAITNNNDVTVNVTTFSSGEYGLLITNSGADSEVVELSLPDAKKVYWNTIEADSLTAKAFRINGISSEIGLYGPEKYDTIPPFSSTVSETVNFSAPGYSINYLAVSCKEVAIIKKTKNKKETQLMMQNGKTFSFPMEVDRIDVFSSNGKKVQTVILADTQSRIDISRHLAQGIYIMQAMNLNRTVALSKFCVP